MVLKLVAMSYGSGGNGDWGFASVIDWLQSVILSFPSPWSVAPHKGKYDGTEITDGRGTLILRFWDFTGEPSSREKALFGENWSPEAWKERRYDCHWESERSLSIAEYVVSLRNAISDGIWRPEHNDLATIIVSAGSWHDDIFREIVCGGPHRRPAEPSDPETRRILHYPPLPTAHP